MTRIAHSEREIPREIPREALAAAGVAATLAAALAWFGPPGSDFAAHLYQSALFEDHGFGIWNNFWYAGRYSFVTYSVLYYPLAALLGIKLLAVASIATAALAFGVVAAREWGPASLWSNRSFAVVWAGVVLSGAFPFALGMALALLALWALQAGRRGRFALLTALVLAASPVAFVLLAVVIAGIGLSRAPCRSELALPLGTLAVATGVEFILLRLFPASGRFPFSLPEFAAASVFCGLGILLTWRVRAAGVLRWMYVVYLAACTTAYLVPSSLGENIARLRYSAIPIARGWFRQDDFPRNGVLYAELDRAGYLAWLRSLGVRYVVLPDAPLDYSAKQEGALLAGGRSGLRVAFRSAHTTIYAVPSPRAIVTGPGSARVLALGQNRITVALGRPGRYRIATNWSPYWRTGTGCLSKGTDGTVRLSTPRAGVVRLDLSINAHGALAALEGGSKSSCAREFPPRP